MESVAPKQELNPTSTISNQPRTQVRFKRRQPRPLSIRKPLLSTTKALNLYRQTKFRDTRLATLEAPTPRMQSSRESTATLQTCQQPTLRMLSTNKTFKGRVRRLSTTHKEEAPSLPMVTNNHRRSKSRTTSQTPT